MTNPVDSLIPIQSNHSSLGKYNGLIGSLRIIQFFKPGIEVASNIDKF